MPQSIRVLVVDLNNFSMYPTMAVGYLAAVLRRDGMHVEVMSPLSIGVPGVVREPRESRLLDVARRANYVLEQAPGGLASCLRHHVHRFRERAAKRHHPRATDLLANCGPERFDVVLVSTYLMYFDVCEQIGRMCESVGVPMVVGGSYFAEPEVAGSWMGMTGLSALISGEVELHLPEIVRTLLNGGDPSRFPGVRTPARDGGGCPPLIDLDSVPFPDYSDFPWSRYPSRIVPIITGRGCGWGACTFCSDVHSTAGRSFRSRSPDNVLQELAFQSERHQTSRFVFTDLKLNSSQPMLEALVSQMPRVIRSPQWIASVHVGKQPNGLDGGMLQQMKEAGVARLTTGLESGSQRILDAFAKGSDLEVTSSFLWTAHRAGISVRVTMIHGSPGETPDDVMSSARFLERHRKAIDRVSLNRFQVMMGPTFLRRFDENPDRYPTIIARERVPRMAYVRAEMSNSGRLSYVRATQRLLGAVHDINRKRLPTAAGAFEGVM